MLHAPSFSPAADPLAPALTAPASAAALPADALPAAPPPFLPREPQTLAETGLAVLEIEALILKQLLMAGPATGRKIAEQIKLPFPVVLDVLRGLKGQLLVAYKSLAAVGDYEHELTEGGISRAQWFAQRCTYCGAAPVTLSEYVHSVREQSVQLQRPSLADLQAALADLSLSPAVVSQVGQAVRAGRGFFIFGAPGNGKTSIAERVIRALSPHVWIPRTISIGGEIVRLFDPANHEEAPLAGGGGLLDPPAGDRRWVRIKRPAIIVGGELTFAQLELIPNPITGIIEAPVQLKANNGVLVVDDFGRQRISTTELLNRWIVPLEKGHDYLCLPSGRQIQAPFDQLLVFSTNLEPRRLVDEAFLRRIPYKIQVPDPSPADFRALFCKLADQLGVRHDAETVNYLLREHFEAANRPLRYCHARDLLLQVRTYCEFHELPLELTREACDVAVLNYFSMLSA